MLNEQLRELIKREADALYDALNEKAQEVDSYDFGLPMVNRQTQPIIDCLTQYADKWQAAEQRAERYEKALKEVQAKAKRGIFPHLPVEVMGAQMCIEIDQYVTDLLTPKTGSDERRL